MLVNDYLLQYEEISHLPINNLLEVINNTEGIGLNQLKVMDLSFHNGKPIYPGIGVYIFRSGKEVILVGKVSSMSFTERIAKHFDLRKGAWFNTLVKLICLRHLQLTENTQNLQIASECAFKNLNLILINFQYENHLRINRIERLLRSCTPCLNKFKYLRHKDLNITVHNY